MEWINTFAKALNYVEENLLEDISIEDIAEVGNISPYYFQKAFQIFADMSVTEYIRGRRLYQAACELRATKIKVIDCAYKYLYETPESFTKAFTRFHGSSPARVRNGGIIKSFLPLKVHIEIKGGYDMDFTIEEMKSFKVIGIYKDIPFENGYAECPKFWDEFVNKYCTKLGDGSAISQAVEENSIGEFGVCIDEGNNGAFRYMIAGRYKGGPVPEGMIIHEFPDLTWAKFKCIGPMPGALQALNTRVWNEWVPNCTDYDLAGNFNIEWYANNNVKAADYESGIWLPVTKKK